MRETARLATRRASSSTGEGDTRGARASHQKGCALDDASACAHFALMAAKGDGGPKDESAGASAADRACKAKLPVGCVLYGLSLVMASGWRRTSKRRAPRSIRRAAPATMPGVCAATVVHGKK
jgi:TPR repeat protein